MLPFPLTRRRGIVPPSDLLPYDEEYDNQYGGDPRLPSPTARQGILPLDSGSERIGYPPGRADVREFLDSMSPVAEPLTPGPVRPFSRGILPLDSESGNVRPRGSAIEGLLERERAAPLAAPIPTSDQPLNVPIGGRSRPPAPLPYPDIPMPDTGITVEDSPLARRRRDYIMEHAARNPDGSFAGPGENVHIKRSAKDIALSALWGLLQGAGEGRGLAGGIGGAVMGGLGATAKPMMGRAYRFDVEQAPRIQRQLAEQEAERQRREQEQDRQLKTRRQEADIQRTQASTKDADLERRYRESQIGLNEARTEAALTGRPVVRDIVRDGKVITFQVHPDGSVTSLGGSAKAAMQGEALRTREGIAGRQIESRENIAGQQIQGRENVAGQQIQSREGIAGQQTTGRNQRAVVKPSNLPKAATDAAKNVTTLKTDAEGAWEAWKSFVPAPGKTAAENNYDHEQLRVAASRAQARYNSAAQSLGQQHGKYFHVTPDAGGSGWHYVEPMQAEEQVAPSGRGIVPTQNTTRPVSQIEGSPKFPGYKPLY